MVSRALVLWLIPVFGLAYTPPAHEILSRMEAAMRVSRPLAVKTVRETPDAYAVREGTAMITSESGRGLYEDFGGTIPFSLFTLSKKEITQVFGSVFHEKISVSLDRIGAFVCYLIDGGRKRLWLRKSDLVPIKAESLSSSGEWITCLYLDFVILTKGFLYPARTEVYRDGSSLFVDRLVAPLTYVDRP
jgi:hypothetical protein